MLQRVEDVLHAAMGQIHFVDYHFYHALVLAACYEKASPKQKKSTWKTLKRIQKKMEQWVKHCPENFEHKEALIAAEMARLSNNEHGAMTYYDKAIRSAHENDYIQYEAVCNERAADFYFSKNRQKVARTYLLEARYSYLKWGATGKVVQMDAQHPELSVPTSETDPHTITTEHSTDVLDLNTVIKASQVLSGEIVLSRLVEQMMAIMIENAGAQKGFLILQRQDQLWVEATATVIEDAKIIADPIPLEKSTELSEAIVRYVARTQELVVLNNASLEGLFTGDSHVVSQQSKSILCLPIMNQRKQAGILYLENNLTIGAFTPDRLEMLNLLSAQAAISLENAGLYQNLETANAQLEDYSHTLEQRVEERTRELQQTQSQLIAEMERELKAAHDLQMNLMPTESPQIEHIEVSGRCIPATHVGGDYFQYFITSQNRLVLSMADVTGHAMEAAIPAVMFDGILESQMEREERLEDLFKRLNNTLHRKLSDHTYVCFVMGEFDPKNRYLRLCNAGCPYPYHYEAKSNTLQELQLDAYPLGVSPNATYQTVGVALQPGDGLIFCSDGIIEAENSAQEQFGFDRTEDLARTACSQNHTAEATLNHILETVNAFQGHQTQMDDMTCIVARISA